MPVRDLKDGTIQIQDRALVGTTPNSVTVNLEVGDLKWTERTPVTVIKDRGALSHARKAAEEVFDVEFSMMFQSLSKHAATTPYDALKRSGGAAAWASTEPKGDAYCVNLKFSISDPAGGADEVVFLEQFHPEELSPLNEGEEFSSFSVKGRAQRNPLLRAEALWQANKYDASGILLDLTGNGHDAQLGSTSGADTNDPKWLPFNGLQYAEFPGIIGDNIEGQPAILSTTPTTLDMRFRVALDDWTPAAQQGISGGTSDIYAFNITASTGIFSMSMTSAVGGVATVSSTAAPTVSDGDILWIRFSLNTDTGFVTFYTSTDTTNDHTEVTWTQLGSSVDTGNTGDLHANVAGSRVMLGAKNLAGASPITGQIYAAAILEDSVVVASPNLEDDATSPFASFTDTEANTWNINRTSTGRKLAVVDRPMFLLGTDDYLQAADHANLDMSATRSFTVVYAGRMYNLSPGADQVFAGKRTSPDAGTGYVLYHQNAGTVIARIDDGPVDINDSVSAAAIGTAFTAALVRNVTDDDLEGFVNGSGSGSPTTDSTTATLANSLTLHIGADGGGSGRFYEGEFFAAAVFREAPPAEDMLEIHRRLLLIKANS